MKKMMTQEEAAMRKASRKIATVVAVILVLAAVIVIIIGIVQKRQNDGGRFARSLSEQIGINPDVAQKYAKVKLATTSEYACINILAQEYDFLYESKKTVQVRGITIPQWVILLNVENNAVSEVTYYDYKQLSKYGNGVKAKQHLITDGATAGMGAEEVEGYFGFAPLCTVYAETGMTQYYKYYYKDKNSKNTVCYTVTADYTDQKLKAIEEKENYFIMESLTINQ